MDGNNINYGDISKTILDIGDGDFTLSFWMAKNNLSWDGSNGYQIVVFGTQNSDNATGLTVYQDGRHREVNARIGSSRRRSWCTRKCTYKFYSNA